MATRMSASIRVVNTSTNSTITQSGSGYLDIHSAGNGTTTESANQGIMLSQLLATGDDANDFGSVGRNTSTWDD